MSSSRDNRYDGDDRFGDRRGDQSDRRRSRNQGCTLFVRNVSDRVRYDDVKKLFDRYGNVIDVTIPLDYYSRVPKGFCFVEFDDPRDAEDALHHMGRAAKLYGRELEIEFANGVRKTPADMRNRDRPNYDDEDDPTDDRRSRRSSSRGGNGRRRSRSPDHHRDSGWSRRRRYSPSPRSRSSPVRTDRRRRSRSGPDRRDSDRMPRRGGGGGSPQQPADRQCLSQQRTPPFLHRDDKATAATLSPR